MKVSIRQTSIRILLLAIVFAFVATTHVNSEGLDPAFSAQLGHSIGRYLGDRFEIHKKLGIPRFEYVGWPPRRVLYSGENHIEEMNLVVDLPGKPWKCLGPTKKEKPLSVLLARTRPDIGIALKAEPVGLRDDIPLRDLLGVSHGRVKNSSGGVVLPGAWYAHAGNIRGIGHEALITGHKNKESHCAVWIAVQNGYLYHVIASGSKGDRAAVNQALQSFLTRIRSIETRSVAKNPRNSGVSGIRPKNDQHVVWASDDH